MGTESIIIPILLAFGSSALVAISKALYTLGQQESLAEIQHYPRYYALYRLIERRYNRDKWKQLFRFIGQTKRIVRILYAVSATTFFLILIYGNAGTWANREVLEIHMLWMIVAWIVIGLFSLLLDFIFRMLAAAMPLAMLKLCTLPAWVYLILFYPITSLLLKVGSEVIDRVSDKEKSTKSERVSDLIEKFVNDSDIKHLLSPTDHQLLHAMGSFHDKMAREIMVPRIDVIGIDVTTSIDEAAKIFREEGYSRLPVYRESIDQIVGILLYKELLRCLIDGKTEHTVEELVSPVLFTPESKKISHLLQDFRAKQSHLAIVVDEYGGTEGIVTIEDILEELVGEIADEYDFDEEQLYIDAPSGGWIVDAKMSTIDIEKELGIEIPSAPDYDTIGGYIYNKAGSIPEKGWTIHHDNFDLEVTASNERAIEKIRVIPTKPA
ncbi:MAG: hemolysin family protein [Simkaniaceae bacterium]|nr:hemolysin family protein [Simkaniaceae bacterium]